MATSREPTGYPARKGPVRMDDVEVRADFNGPAC
jgi:hypothetical protein